MLCYEGSDIVELIVVYVLFSSWEGYNWGCYDWYFCVGCRIFNGVEKNCGLFLYLEFIVF